MIGCIIKNRKTGTYDIIFVNDEEIVDIYEVEKLEVFSSKDEFDMRIKDILNKKYYEIEEVGDENR